MDRREALHGNLDACIKSALPLPLIKECQYLALTPFVHRWGWKALEAHGVESVFPRKDQAIDYAQNRICWRLSNSVPYQARSYMKIR